MTWNTHDWLSALWGLSSLMCAEMWIHKYVPVMGHTWLVTSCLCSSHDKYRNKFTLFQKHPSPYLLLPKLSNHTNGRKCNREIKGQKITSKRRNNSRMQNISAQFTHFFCVSKYLWSARTLLFRCLSIAFITWVISCLLFFFLFVSSSQWGQIKPFPSQTLPLE